MRAKLNPYSVVFFGVALALIWRPFLIGFYGDDYGLTTADSLMDALFYDTGRRERILYFIPIALPRYVFGHNSIAWGIWSVFFSALTAVSVFSFFKSVLSRLSGLGDVAIPASMVGAGMYLFMPWSLTPVLWSTSISLLVMVSLLALAGTVLFSHLRVSFKTIIFAALFSSASLMYESVWGAWIPLLLIKLVLDTPQHRPETAIVGLGAVVAQMLLVINYLPSLGMQSTVKGGEGFSLISKLYLFLENIAFRLPFEIISSMGVFGLVSIVPLLVVFVVLFKNRSCCGDGRFWGVVLACLAGILGGVFVISLGNYRVAGTTEDGRTLFMVSFWLALLVTLVTGVLLSYPWRIARWAGVFVGVMVLIGFMFRAGDWVKGYVFQRETIASVPTEKIAQLAGYVDTLDENGNATVLLVEFGTPMHVFHGMHNNRGTRFITDEIRKRTGLTFFTVPANGRVWGSEWDGKRLIQPTCARGDEIREDYPARSVIFWNVATGEVQKLSPSFSHGCTRPVQRFEFLGELLYPFMGNPRRF